MRNHTKISRRTLLKQLGAAGVAAWALPQIVPARVLGADAPSNKLNVALLSCGGRAQQDLPDIVRGGGNVLAICDVNATQIEKLRAVGAKAGEAGASVATAKAYEDYRQLLANEKSVDAVVVASGQRWHPYMSKAALLAGKHVFCEKPLSHSCAEARELRDLGRKTKLATQIGSQGGASDSFRRAMEVIQAGMLGQIKEAHCWINRSFPPSAAVAQNADPIPAGLNWDFWCGPSQVLPFKNYYLGGCLAWGRWLEFGDGHLADMGAHGLNLPWRALKLGNPLKASVESAEPPKDSYPSANIFRWDFAAREGFGPVSVYWHDGPKAGPPDEQGKELLATYGMVPGDGVLFVGEKGLLLSGAWGTGGVMKLQGEAKFRGVLDHAAAKDVPATVARLKGQNHMHEWLDACRGKGTTFQPFSTAASIAEIAMVGMVALRYGKPIEWDSDALKAKGAPRPTRSSCARRAPSGCKPGRGSGPFFPGPPGERGPGIPITPQTPPSGSPPCRFPAPARGRLMR
jgi:hypothetical protein